LRERVTVAGRVETSWFGDLNAAVAAVDDFQAPGRVEELIVVLPPGEFQGLERLAVALDRLPLRATIAVEGLPVESAAATPSFVVFSTGPNAAAEIRYVVGKRVFDFCAASAGLVLLGPIVLAIASITLWRSGRPVLIAQERVGGGGRRFKLLKFRSLPVASLANSDRAWAPVETDRWGWFLRRTGLDELPQLLNVLKGDMSLVGPRPERPWFVEQFRRQLPIYSARHRLRSGITGWAQVNGWRGDSSIHKRVEHDLYYLRHWSPGFDAHILWLTLRQLVRQLCTSGGSREVTPDARPV
jgi:lipopolysaccharide/colanic/teichoic acid biosynthesis glycosyltransferase